MGSGAWLASNGRFPTLDTVSGTQGVSKARPDVSVRVKRESEVVEVDFHEVASPGQTEQGQLGKLSGVRDAAGVRGNNTASTPTTVDGMRHGIRMSIQAQLMANLALYGCEIDIDVARLYPLLLDISNEFESQPNIAVFLRHGDVEPREISAKNFHRRMVDQSNRNFTMIGLVETLHNPKINRRDARFQISFNSKIGSFFLSIQESTLDSIITKAMKYIVSVNSTVGVKYGIGYVMPRFLGPSYYAQGAVLNPDRQSEVDRMRIRNWLDDLIFDKTYMRGRFRDVYTVNVLSERHIHNTIDGELFLDWIVSSDSGYSNEICSDLWEWRVPDIAKERVRQKLLARGLLIAGP